jgi:adenosylhomocysteine nucleosidase
VPEPESVHVRVVVLISADVEWEVVRRLFTHVEPSQSPLGSWFLAEFALRDHVEPVLFFHGGWGKIAAAASAQYVLDRWAPQLLVNLGTCGGFEGQIERGTVILVERTIVYDILEQMGDQVTHIDYYAKHLDLDWLGDVYPHAVLRTVLVSGDRDLLPEDIPRLMSEFGAVAGDWESGAIAYVATRNKTRCLILRGVSDLVGVGGGEAYAGRLDVYVNNASQVMRQLVNALPAWLDQAGLDYYNDWS